MFCPVCGTFRVFSATNQPTTMTSESPSMLCFFSGAADAKPGEGINEFLSPEATRACASLPTNFRRVLGNFGEAVMVRKGDKLVGKPYSYFVAEDGRRYPTVEHGYHAAKIRMLSGRGKAAARAFSVHLDRVRVGWSGRNARKKQLQMLTPQPQGWDAQKWNVQKWAVLESLMYARFSQNDTLREMLLTIPDSVQLWHGTIPRRVIELENVRAKLRNRA